MIFEFPDDGPTSEKHLTDSLKLGTEPLWTVREVAKILKLKTRDSSDIGTPGRITLFEIR